MFTHHNLLSALRSALETTSAGTHPASWSPGSPQRVQALRAWTGEPQRSRRQHPRDRDHRGDADGPLSVGGPPTDPGRGVHGNHRPPARAGLPRVPGDEPGRLLTAGPRDLGTSGPRDLGTSGPRDLGTSGPRDLGTSGPRDLGTSGPRDLGTSGPRDLDAIRPRNRVPPVSRTSGFESQTPIPRALGPPFPASHGIPGPPASTPTRPPDQPRHPHLLH